MNALIATVLLGAAIVTVRPGTAAAAQAPANAPTSAVGARKAASAAGKSECVRSVGLCVTVPQAWQRLGDVFDDLGFVVAEPHPGSDAATWPQLTVAAIDVPAQKDGNAPSLDSLIELVLTPDGSFTSAETLQRTRLLLNGNNAEIVRVRLHEEANDVPARDVPNVTDAIEAVALIQGDAGLVYSIALRCAPQDFTRLEAVFQKVISSWRIQPPATQPAEHSATQSANPSQPKQDSDKK